LIRSRTQFGSVTSFASHLLSLPPDYAEVLESLDTERTRILRRIVYLGFAFAVIFTASNVVQSFLTTLYPDGPGFMSIAALQFAFAIGSLFAPCRIGMIFSDMVFDILIK
jgi:hypothetical protein